MVRIEHDTGRPLVLSEPLDPSSLAAMSSARSERYVVAFTRGGEA